MENKDKKKIFIGAAWPYANNSLHLGHVSALIGSDILARYFRKSGHDVLFVSGSDVHGTPIVVSSEKENIAPDKIAQKYHKEFIETLIGGLNFSYDNYTTTATENHKKIVQEIFLKLYEQGDIYKKTQDLPYCKKCKRFLPDRYIEGTCPKCKFKDARGDQCDECSTLLDPKDLIDPRCKTCGSKPDFRQSEHFFLKLSAYQDQIKNWVSKSHGWRTNALGFTNKLIKEGIHDRAITRDTKWGIPIPLPGYDEKSIYVWFEAVCGYFSASQGWAKDNNQPDKWRDFWQNENSLHYYVHGKDNIPFHTIIWPTILLSYGGLHLPDRIISSEYLTLEKKQFSKSRHWAVWLPEFLQKFDADTLRYFLIANGPETSDADFSWKDFQQRTNKELIGNFTNFIHRTAHLISSNFPDGVKYPEKLDEQSNGLIELAQRSFEKVGTSIEKGDFREGIRLVFGLAEEGNRYLATKEPWKTIKTDPREAQESLAVCGQIIHCLGILINPFLPQTGLNIFKLFRKDYNLHVWEYEEISLFRFEKPELLFNRIEDAEIIEEENKLGKN